MQQNACLPEEIHKSDDTTGLVRRFYLSWKSYDKYTEFYGPETVVRNRGSATTLANSGRRRSGRNYIVVVKNKMQIPQYEYE